MKQRQPPEHQPEGHFAPETLLLIDGLLRQHPLLPIHRVHLLSEAVVSVGHINDLLSCTGCLTYYKLM